MSYDVVIATVQAELIAAVRSDVRLGEVGRAWKPALDQVWAFLHANPGIVRGHNLFLYHHPARREDPMSVDFGVQVVSEFEAAGNVRCVPTPAGEIARTVHVGPYDRIGAAHDAIHAWCAAHGRTIGGASWETYGDHNDDPALLETTITYLLA
ncbi:MAG: GyrI-like domain-containing protein [Candidatus Limnocylindrales bacterium]